MKTIKLNLSRSFLWASFICYASWQMLLIVWPHTSFAWDVDFLQTKEMIIHLDHYRVAFYSHIFSSLIVLVSGAFLFSNVVLRKFPKIHRNLGKTYVALVLLISAPSGLIMGFYANGGWLAILSFLVLSPLWWWFTWKGFQTARQQNFKAHRIWMIRSYALTLSAVTLRFFQMILGTWFYLEPEFQYILVSWGSWMLNLGAVEVWLLFRGFRLSKVLKYSSP